MIRAFLLHIFLSFRFVVLHAQHTDGDTLGVETVPPLKVTRQILTERIDRIPIRSVATKELKWTWQCLGPDIQPVEHNVGGRALPKYAENRGNGTGRINYLFAHPKKTSFLWACSPTGGMWFTSDNGENWTVAGTDRLPVSGVSSVAVHPRKWKRWWIATGDGDDVFQYTDGVWMSPDAGKTYISMNGKTEGEKLPFGNADDIKGQISEIELHPRDASVLYAATNRGLFRADEAMNPDWIEWTKLFDGYFYDIQTIRGKSRRKDVIIASGDQLVWSMDGGKTFRRAARPPYSGAKEYPFLRMKTVWSKGLGNKVYVTVTCSKAHTMSALGDGSLYVFDLNSGEWMFIRSLKEGMNNMIPTRARALTVSPNDHSVLLCGNVQPVFRSTDGGTKFSRVEKNQIHDDCHHLVFSMNGKYVFAGHDGGVSRSDDGGLTWKTMDKGIGAANVFGIAVAQQNDPQVLFGGYDTGGNLLMNGEWKHVSWGDGFESVIHPKDPKIMFSTMQNGNLQRSVDGNSFDTGKNPSGSKTEWHTWIRMHPTHHQMVFCAGTKLMRSRDLGDSWEPVLDVSKMGEGLYNIYRFYLSEQHPGILYAYVLDSTRVNPQIWRTYNITETNPAYIQWEKLPPLPVEGWIMSISPDDENPSACFILLNRSEPDGKFFRFDGERYEDETANLGFSKCEAMVMQRGSEPRFYVGSNYGIFTKRKSESQWTLMLGLPGTQIKALDINYVARKLVVGTYGRGVWWGDLLNR